MFIKELEKPKPSRNELIKSYKEKARAKDGTPLYFSKKNVTKMFGKFEKRKVQTFEILQQTLTKDQVKI